MQATARLNFDRQYYELLYSEWLRYRSRYRRVAIQIAVLLTGVGVGLSIWLSSVPLAIAVVAMGVADVVETMTYRKRWLRTALNAKSTSQGELKFMDSEVHIHSDHARGSIRYEGFRSATATPKGIFLVPYNGASIFVPLSTVEPQDVIESLVAFLLNKVNGS